MSMKKLTTAHTPPLSQSLIPNILSEVVACSITRKTRSDDLYFGDARN